MLLGVCAFPALATQASCQNLQLRNKEGLSNLAHCGPLWASELACELLIKQLTCHWRTSNTGMVNASAASFVPSTFMLLALYHRRHALCCTPVAPIPL